MRALGADSLVWNAANNATAWSHFLGGGAPGPYAVPARATDVAGMPPTYLTVNELDPLRDEGLELGRRLLGAGVSVELHCWPGAPHGFATLVPDADVSRRAHDALLEALARGVGAAVRPPLA